MHLGVTTAPHSPVARFCPANIAKKIQQTKTHRKDTTTVDYNSWIASGEKKFRLFLFFVFELCVTLTMKIEEAILYCLTSQNRGMRTEQIAEMINRQRLHIRKDGQPVNLTKFMP